MHFSFSTFLSISCHIPGPTVFVSHFPGFSLSSPYSRSYIVQFSFSRYLSVSRHIPGKTVFVSHFTRFSLSSPYSMSYSVHFSFFTLISDFVIFQVVTLMFLIFHDFQFSCHIPCPTADIPKFSTFFSFPRHISRPKVCISHFP